MTVSESKTVTAHEIFNNNSTTGFEPGVLYCFNNNLKGEYCNHCKSKSDCRSLTIKEQRKYFEEHPEQREKKNARRREWGKKPENKAKLKKYTENFWERKAREVVTND